VIRALVLIYLLFLLWPKHINFKHNTASAASANNF